MTDKLLKTKLVKASLILPFIVCAFAAYNHLSRTIPIGGNKFETVYSLDDGARLVVSDYDCGATCDFTITTYIDRDYFFLPYRKQMYKCQGMKELTFKDVTKSSATVSSLEYSARGRASCDILQVGDMLTY